MRGNTVTCKRCHRRVAWINPGTGEVEWADGARLLSPTDETFRLGNAIVVCPQGHRRKLG